MQLMLRGMNLGLFVLGNWFQISNAQIRYFEVLELDSFFKTGEIVPLTGFKAIEIDGKGWRK